MRRCENGLPYDAYEGAGRKVPRTDSSRTYLLGRDCGQAPSAEVGAIATSEQGGAPNTSIFQSSPGAFSQPLRLYASTDLTAIGPCQITMHWQYEAPMYKYPVLDLSSVYSLETF